MDSRSVFFSSTHTHTRLLALRIIRACSAKFQFTYVLLLFPNSLSAPSRLASTLVARTGPAWARKTSSTLPDAADQD